MNLLKLCLIFSFVLTLSACGGGGGSSASTPTTPTPPPSGPTVTQNGSAATSGAVVAGM